MTKISNFIVLTIKAFKKLLNPPTSSSRHALAWTDVIFGGGYY